jgi:hypothetical protein
VKLKINALYKIPDYGSILQLLEFGISDNKNIIYAKLETVNNRQLLITRKVTEIEKWQIYL